MLAFWTAPGKRAPYLCIEPWHGCAAAWQEGPEFTDKAHCITLAPGARRTLGYQVTETADEEGNLRFSIDWGTDTGGQKLILDYLQYLEYLSKWDGKLPSVVGDGTGIMITIPGTAAGTDDGSGA